MTVTFVLTMFIFGNTTGHETSILAQDILQGEFSGAETQILDKDSSLFATFLYRNLIRTKVYIIQGHCLLHRNLIVETDEGNA